MNEPKIRFKGFQGEWENPTIANTFEIRNGYTPSKAIKAFWDGGTIPWFRMEDIRENGGILKDAIQHITPLGVKGDGLFETNSIILATTATIGVHAMLIAGSLANQRFTNFSIRKSLKDIYNPMFVYYSFFGIDEWCKKNTNSGGLLAVNIPYLLKQSFHTPILPEQQSIASYFQHLDNLIQSTTKKIESLKQVKAASLQSMFPQEGETTPRVRFKGFEGKWEECLLKDKVNNITTGKLDANAMVPNGKYRFYTCGKEYFKIDKYAFDDEALIISGNGENVGYIHYYNGKFNAYQRTYVLTSFTLNVFYLEHYLKARLSIRINKEKSVANTPYIKMDTISDMNVLYPNDIAEQRAIASFFTNLDRQITLQSQRLEKLKQIKAACLDKMFV